MAVTDSTTLTLPSPDGPRRPAAWETIKAGFIASVVTWAVAVASMLVAAVLPGDLNVPLQRATGADGWPPFDATQPAGVLGDVAVGLAGAGLFGWALSRFLLTRTGRRPSWFWTAAGSLVGISVLFVLPPPTALSGVIVALIVTHRIAFDRTGEPVPSPLRVPHLRLAVAACVAVAGVALVAAAARQPLIVPTSEGMDAVTKHRLSHHYPHPAHAIVLDVNVTNASSHPLRIVGARTANPAAVDVLGLASFATSTRWGTHLTRARPRTLATGVTGSVSILVVPKCSYDPPNTPLRVDMLLSDGGTGRVTLPWPENGLDCHG